MAPTVGDDLLKRLRQWNVEHLFGYPGDGINGIVAALGRADDCPRFVQARHEEMAAFEAVGYAKFTGRPGVRCDPDIPPIPPHADFEQIKDAAEAIIKGDPGAVDTCRHRLGLAAVALAAGVAALGIRGRIPHAAALHRLHSGHVGDYVAWLIAGVAAFGLLLLT